MANANVGGPKPAAVGKVLSPGLPILAGFTREVLPALALLWAVFIGAGGLVVFLVYRPGEQGR